MDNDVRLEALEGEFKLLKSELKQTLSSVRDFLLDFKLPPVVEEAEPIQEVLTTTDQDSAKSTPQEPVSPTPDYGGYGGGDNGSGVNSGGDNDGDGDHSGRPDNSYSEPEPEMSAPVAAQDEITHMEDDLDDIDDADTGISSGDMPSDIVEEEEEAQETAPAALPALAATAYAPSTPPVNLLANLIRWAAEAMQEIGAAQLPVFLDVYATSGNLTEEMKQNILHLAEVTADPAALETAAGSGKVFNEQLSICMEIGSFNGEVPAEIRTRIRRLSELILQQTAYTNKADVWSQMLLKLHGILSHGGTPVQPLVFNKAAAKEELPEAAADGVPTEDSGLDLDSEQMDEDLLERYDLSEDGAEIDEEDIQPPGKNTRLVKLRMVLPVGDGGEQELDLGNLFIATENIKQNNGHKNLSIPKRK